jgi:hypothetical protein
MQYGYPETEPTVGKPKPTQQIPDRQQARIGRKWLRVSLFCDD